ncbi:hypothetical protein [Micromonospora sp. NPDC047740]|uniref:hypothetical protein n=1 Tax=Micromonospora sp. NPDC047740 TaxID=3364254 RepID=UPI0037221817
MTGIDGSDVRLEPESGVVIDEPSEDAIFEAMGDRDSRDNTFLTIEPTASGQEWYATISAVDAGGVEIELRDAKTREHKLYVSNNCSRIATDVTIWIAGRPAFAQRHAHRLESG